ncbi:unnamed protein product [Tilletia caries]|nr:unnamed protein product [Tilletia caries]
MVETESTPSAPAGPAASGSSSTSLVGNINISIGEHFTDVKAFQNAVPIVPTEYKRLQAIIQNARCMSVVCSDNTSGCVTTHVCQRPAALIALLQKLKVSVAGYYHSYYTAENWRGNGDVQQHASSNQHHQSRLSSWTTPSHQQSNAN